MGQKTNMFSILTKKQNRTERESAFNTNVFLFSVFLCGINEHSQSFVLFKFGDIMGSIFYAPNNNKIIFLEYLTSMRDGNAICQRSRNNRSLLAYNHLAKSFHYYYYYYIRAIGILYTHKLCRSGTYLHYRKIVKYIHQM